MFCIRVCRGSENLGSTRAVHPRKGHAPTYHPSYSPSLSLASLQLSHYFLRSPCGGMQLELSAALSSSESKGKHNNIPYPRLSPACGYLVLNPQLHHLETQSVCVLRSATHPNHRWPTPAPAARLLETIVRLFGLNATVPNLSPKPPASRARYSGQRLENRP